MAKTKPKLLVGRSTTRLDLAAPVSARVQIKHVVLAEAAASRKARQKGPPADLTLNVNVKTEANRKEHLIEVLPRFTLVAMDQGENGGEQLRIEALFVLQYEVSSFEGLRRPNIDAFGELNGLYNVWPYWREYVQSTTVRMGLPPLIIPVFRPLDVSEAPKKNTSAVRTRRSVRSAARRKT